MIFEIYLKLIFFHNLIVGGSIKITLLKYWIRFEKLKTFGETLFAKKKFDLFDFVTYTHKWHIYFVSLCWNVSIFLKSFGPMALYDLHAFVVHLNKKLVYYKCKKRETFLKCKTFILTYIEVSTGKETAQCKHESYVKKKKKSLLAPMQCHKNSMIHFFPFFSKNMFLICVLFKCWPLHFM